MTVKHNLLNTMIDQDNGAETIIPDEELELDLTLDGTEDVDALTEKLKNAEKAKKQILARAKKAEAKLKTLEPQEINKVEAKPQVESDDKLWEIADMMRKGYTRDDAKFIQSNGGQEALRDPNSYVSIALRGIMEQRGAEYAASQTHQHSGMSEVERKYTPEQLKNMTAKELEAILPHTEG